MLREGPYLPSPGDELVSLAEISIAKIFEGKNIKYRSTIGPCDPKKRKAVFFEAVERRGLIVFVGRTVIHIQDQKIGRHFSYQLKHYKEASETLADCLDNNFDVTEEVKKHVERKQNDN